MVAYAFARFRFPGRDIWFMIMLGTMMIPYQVTLIPQYILFHRFGWLNTFMPLTVPSWLGGAPIIIFLLRQFLLSVPRDFDEAAIIDGAGPLRILWSVLIPLMKPALATVCILQFVARWNEFIRPSVYLNELRLYTAAVGIYFFKEMPELAYDEPRDHLLMAAATIMILPVTVMFLFAQRYFVQGVVLSGIKA